MKAPSSRVEPIEGFTALPGCHCVTASFRKMCAFNGYTVSEEMLLGLGAGVGFVYWHQKGQYPMLGGRGNTKSFHQDLSRRTGIVIEDHRTSSAKTAEREMVMLLEAGQPVTIYADMPFLTYLGLPEKAHFGGHAVVVCGYEPAARQVLISDMAPRQTGYKDPILAPLGMDQLAKARGSKCKPFPPENCWFTFDFGRAHPPTERDVRDAISQCTKDMLNPPIQNLGVAGIRTAAMRVKQWPAVFDKKQLRMALFNLYIFRNRRIWRGIVPLHVLPFPGRGSRTDRRFALLRCGARNAGLRRGLARPGSAPRVRARIGRPGRACPCGR